MPSIASRVRGYFSDSTQPRLPTGVIRQPRATLREILRMYFQEKSYKLDQLSASYFKRHEVHLDISFIATVVGLGDPRFNAARIQNEKDPEVQKRIDRRMELFGTIYKMEETGKSKKNIKKTIEKDYAGDLNGDEKWLVETVVTFTKDSLWEID